jgi:hypothetical protein
VPPALWRHFGEQFGVQAAYLASLLDLDPSIAADRAKAAAAKYSRTAAAGLADPASSIGEERFQFDTTMACVHDGPAVHVQSASIPDSDFANAHLFLRSGAAAIRFVSVARRSRWRVL